ncbi:MAG: amidoligase family protein [Ectothiorhodospiraceae bacterium]|nr:amidoligase family protein [Ectothiorhodospiraceae bacterium]
MNAIVFPEFPLPEQLYREDGQPRRLGVELEFAGLPLHQICELVMDLYGGRVERRDPFVQTVTGTRWGDFKVEIDTTLLKDRSYARFLKRLGLEVEPGGRIEDLLARLAGTVVPHEIVSPPIPMAEVHLLEQLRNRLQLAHAQGTRASVLYAFGLHLNPEAPRTDTATILAHLKAFLLLYDWLHLGGEIDWSRRLTPYIDPFPDPYRRLVVAPDYAPELPRLVTDYLRHNTTRNRALDMLPLFRHLLGDRAVRGVPEASLVKPRPAFHYRLPNCRIDEPDWTLAQEWRGWVMVEWLAARPAHLQELGERFLRHQGPPLGGIDRLWAERCTDWLPA